MYVPFGPKRYVPFGPKRYVPFGPKRYVPFGKTLCTIRPFEIEPIYSCSQWVHHPMIRPHEISSANGRCDIYWRGRRCRAAERICPVPHTTSCDLPME